MSKNTSSQQQQQQHFNYEHESSGPKWSSLNRIEQGTSKLISQFELLDKEIKAMQIHNSNSTAGTTTGRGAMGATTKGRVASRSRSRSAEDRPLRVSAGAGAGTGTGGLIAGLDLRAGTEDAGVLNTVRKLFQDTLTEVASDLWCGVMLRLDI